MAIKDDLRKTFSDPTPLYFAAGAAELTFQQAKKVPGLVEQLRAEAPARFEAVRNTDPKDVQEKATGRAKEAQATITAKVNEIVAGLDTDLKKFGETAQEFALRGVGIAAEAAVKARETYEKVAEHGEEAVRSWRGEAADEIVEIAGTVEPDPEPVVTEAPAAAAEKPAPAKKAPAAKKTTVKKAPAAKKPASGATPPAK
ncbi:MULTISPECIES: hypothetical protein [unclassified Streptomyces]|uniref:hypothetical protein n=1 Tax=unclassified Streptomyces TaxID=2593676 RepID=UPI000DBA64BE|nr:MULTISPECIES: hypothetical protein [unclassified Streptomyces]MYT72281.1 hypothetical protein [Streptomyces sp. SID8367]RAJ81696.1 hypothetical protein K377_04717 [Streptomyces sp. PsTaAH-137]